MIGTSIAHYRILEQIGGGGMGVVYKAEDVRLGRFVALKFLPDEFAADAQTLERFRREARAISALNHPNICTLYDIGEEAGRMFLVLELLEGQNLRQFISEKGALPLPQILKVVTDVAEALEAAHEKGILHRDIKPANIFVTHRGTAKILDFGLAKMGGLKRAPAGSVESQASDFDPAHSGGWALGTIAYMSPEQALGKPLDERTDLFSFGTVLYEMATGVVPFSGETTGALFLSVVQNTPVSPAQLNPNLPERLKCIISKCLEKDRESRYQHAFLSKFSIITLQET
jgi:eukaryotic-like serine/threonine-protein kinase